MNFRLRTSILSAAILVPLLGGCGMSAANNSSTPLHETNAVNVGASPSLAANSAASNSPLSVTNESSRGSSSGSSGLVDPTWVADPKN